MIINLDNIKKLNMERYRVYFLALGFSLIEYSIIIYSGFWDNKLNKSMIKGSQILLSEYRKYGVVPLIVLLCGLVIILACFIIQIRIMSRIYGVFTLTSLIIAPIIFLEWLSRVRLNYLISIGMVICFTWFSYTIIASIISLYKWTVKDKTIMLAKLTFIWSVIVAMLGYCIGRPK